MATGVVNQYAVRDFEREDQRVVQALINEGLRQRFGKVNESMNPDLFDIEETYIAQDAVFIVVEHQGDVIGCGALIHEEGSNETARIVRVSVRAKYQGHGLGHKISELLIERARKKGYKEILVETNSDWESALKLYQSLGFQEYSRTNVPEYGYTEVNMFLDL